MAAQYIPVSLEDFEEQFNIPSKKNPTERAFNLIRPQNSEAYYECVLRKTNAGQLAIKVYTSVQYDKTKARGVGEDAIRIVVIWTDNLGWERPFGDKAKRIYRSGGLNATAKDVVERALNRAKEVATEAMKSTICHCGRPMVIRDSKNGKFLSCIGFVKKACNGTKNI